MDNIQDNKELFHFFVEKSEELELLLLHFDDSKEWLKSFNSLVEEINDSKIKQRIAPQMEDLILMADGSAEDKKREAGRIIDEVKEQIFLQKRRLTNLCAPNVGGDKPVNFDGWVIERKNKLFRSSKTDELIQLTPQLGMVFTAFITKKNENGFTPVLSVRELIEISKTNSDDPESAVWTIKGKLNKSLKKTEHYSYKEPIDNADSVGSGKEYHYTLHGREELMSK